MSTVDLSDVSWRKSGRSNGASNANCVEVGFAGPEVVAVRDSKNPDAAALVFPVVGWSSFLRAVDSPRSTA
ncbi:DUF397 domain-containing protein [Saccharothrix saharensis]|uniref:DUF397 domain-containing protein n=1 Tax=Saccharothrix saharensis TaxID=571190 RepID=UPI001B876615|nr:DUF397 domain-containing protein [Saccharothrix saharensis]